MNIVLKIGVVLLALLSLAAGTAKLMQMPQETAFFAKAGLGSFPLLVLGAVQVAGGILALMLKFRRKGLVLTVAGFFASVVVIAMTGDMAFAAVSLVPLLIGIGLIVLIGRTDGSA